MYEQFQQHLQKTLNEIRDAGLYKNERVIITPQSSGIAVEGGQEVINFCANNYLGLADNKELIEAAKARMDARGYGMASVRFICGTQDTHKELAGRKSTKVMVIPAFRNASSRIRRAMISH